MGEFQYPDFGLALCGLRPPDAVNAAGTKWWRDEAMNAMCAAKGLDVEVYAVEKRDGTRCVVICADDGDPHEVADENLMLLHFEVLAILKGGV